MPAGPGGRQYECQDQPRSRDQDGPNGQVHCVEQQECQDGEPEPEYALSGHFELVCLGFRLKSMTCHIDVSLDREPPALFSVSTVIRDSPLRAVASRRVPVLEGRSRSFS